MTMYKGETAQMAIERLEAENIKLRDFGTAIGSDLLDARSKVKSLEFQVEDMQKVAAAVEDWARLKIHCCNCAKCQRLRAFIEKRAEPGQIVEHCDLSACCYRTQRACICLCAKCVEAKARDH